MKNISKRLLSLVLAVMMVVSMMPTTVFAADADTADLSISTADELKAFADAVNAGNSYEGKTVVLTNNIDLEYTAVVIGTKESPFKGTFDGQDHTVDNLTIYEDGSDSDYFADTDDCLGLFGVLNTPGVIKNVIVNNPYIVGNSYVGGIVGMGYTGTIENCHVTGEIDIEGHYMVGGINGHGYAKISNCSVIGEEGWDYNYIGATYKEADLEGDNVGGIVGHNGENNDIVGCTVKNVTVSGTRKIGGIVGIASLGSSITDCVVEGVTVETTATADYAADNGTTMSMGGLVGQYQNRDSGGTITGCTVTDLTFANENDVTIHAGALTGGVRGIDATVGTTEPAITASGNSISGVTGATVTYMEPTPEYIVSVGDQGYETLAEALAAAKTMTGDVTVEIYDKVTLSSNLTGSFDSIKFVGKNAAAEIYLEVQGYITATGKKVAFEDLTLSKSTGTFITNAGFMNVAFGVYDVTEVTYTGCTFANGAYASSGKVTYTDCTFKRSHDKYGLWAYGNVDVTVDSCTFADYRGIKMYAEGAAKTVNLTVKNTDFSAVDNKPAIVLTYGESVTLENNTYSSTGVFELDLDGAPNGTAVTSDVAPTCKNDNGACGVLVDGKIYTTVAQAAAVAAEGSVVTLLHDSAETVELAEGVILDKNGFAAEGVTVKKAGLSGSGTEADPFLINDLEELIWFRDNMNTYTSDRSNQYVGKYVKLMADIDLNGINWTPIGTSSVGDHVAFLGTFDGNGHTISNLYINADGANLGFFARTGSYNETEKAVVKNLNFHNVNVSSNSTGSHAGSYVGGVIANCGGNTYVENVNLTGDIYVVGYGYVGGIVGHGYPKMTDCTVAAEDGSYVKAYYWCAGGATGYAGEGSTFTNVTVSGLDVYGALGAAAAVVGLANDNGSQVCKLTNVHAENVEVTGGNYCSGYVAGNGNTAVMTDVTATNVTLGSGIEATDAVATVNGAAYFTLQAAMAAAQDGDTVKLLADAELTSTLKITSAINLDLNGKTITSTAKYAVQVSGGNADLAVTISNGKIVAAAGSSSNGTSALNVYDGADVTVENVELSGGYYGIKISGYDDYPSDINNNNLTSVVLNGGSVTADNAAIIGLGAYPNTQIDINGAAVTSNDSIAIYHPSYGTLNITDGTITGTTAIYLKAGNLNISGGEIVANGEKADYEYEYSGAVATGDAVVIESCNYGGYPTPVVSITGGTFTSANNKAVASYNTSDAEAVTGFISGGSFSSDVTEYLAAGVTLAKKPDGTFAAGKLPEAQIDDLGNVTIVDGNPEEEELVFDGSYYIYDLIGETGLSTGTEPFDLQLAMKFTAKDDATSAQLNAYSEYFTDFHIQISGLKEGYIYGDGCYLAGYYKSFGAWVVIPLDGFKIENGKAYPMITAAGFNFTYEDICSGVKEFTCGIYMAPEILAANPDLEVSVSLGLSETVDDALASEFITVGEPLEYGVKELHGAVDVDGVGYDTLTEALENAKDGSVVTLLQDVKVTGKVIIDDAITLNGNGFSITADETATWYTVSGKLQIKNYYPWVLLQADGIVLKDIVINANNCAGGVKIENAENVVFDNVSILGAKADAITVVGSLNLKTYLKVDTTSSIIDARSGVAAVEPGTVFDLTKWMGNVSPATSDLKGAVDTEGNPFFDGYSSTTYILDLNKQTSLSNVTLLDDVTISKDISASGTLNLNGYDLTVTDGKYIKISGKLTVTGEGNLSAAFLLSAKAATLTAPENMDVTTSLAGYKAVYENGTYKLTQIVYVAQIGSTKYETFEDALNAVQDGETITILDVEGSEKDKEIDFTKDISFIITGTAPSYALPTITFQNATVTIQDAEILIPELDARQNATINVVDSTVHDAGGNSIVKSYYNGAINISGTSVVYTMQVTTMGYITISNEAKLNATWQTNVYGNGMIVVEGNATFATAALQLIAKDYSGRDNTDADRVGKPATIVVDGANMIVGKVYSDNGADYSYNSSKGINIGTLDGKSAVLDIKNGAEVNIYMANGETANIGANGTVNVDASSLILSCRAENGTVTLANNGTINVSGTSDIAATKVTGSGWVYMNGVTLDADTKLIGAKVRFASGTNNIDGSVIDDGFFQVGIGAYNGVDANVDTVNGVVVNVKNATIGSSGSTYAGWIGTGYYDTDAEKAAAMTDAKYVLNIENSIAAFGYLHISNDGEMNVTGDASEKVWYNNSDYSFYAGEIIVNGTATFDDTDVLALFTKVSCDNGTDKPGTVNIVNDTEYEAERHNGAVAGNCVVLYKTGVMNVDGANLYIGDLTSIAANAVLNIGANATALGAITNNGTINLTTVDATLTTPETQKVATTVEGYEVVYEDGTYKLVKKPVYVAYIGEQGYETVDEAVKAAKDGDTIRLDSADTAISMNATVDGNRTITFTGVALVDWTKGNLWIGRNGTGSGKVIFDGVTITSAVKKNPAGTGIHVSSAKANSTGTCDGVLVIKNSTIELDYLINRNEVIVSDNSDLTIYGGTYVHGRNADESDSGTDETATLTVKDSKLTIVNSNGEGFGGESYGELILANAQVVCQSAFIVNANGAVKMDANSTITATKLTGAGSIEIDATGVTADKVVITAATANFTGTVSVTGNDSAEAKVNADNIQVAIKEISYMAQNLQTGAKYEDLQTALNEAADGQTVQLLTDVTAEFVYVGVGKTLDLNGNKLTAGTVSASFTTSYIIDSVGGGLLVVDKENISLNKGNKQLPIWTAEGAIFEEFGFRQRLTFSSDDSIAYFDFYIAKTAAETLVDDYLANGTLTLRVKATWTSSKGTVNTQYFEYTAEMISKMIADSWDGNMFTLKLGGIEDVTDLTLTAEVVSTANSQASVVVSSDPQTRS